MFRHLLKHYSQPSFTLMELLVVISIMGILASAAVANYRTSGYQRELLSDTREFASTIREAQADSLSGKLINNIRPDHGCGVYLENNDYILFADNGDHIYQEDEKIRKIVFTSRVSLVSSTDSCNTIIFTPPNGAVDFYYYDSDGESLTSVTSSVVTFTLRHSATNQDKLIRVNKFGQIDIPL